MNKRSYTVGHYMKSVIMPNIDKYRIVHIITNLSKQMILGGNKQTSRSTNWVCTYKGVIVN